MSQVFLEDAGFDWKVLGPDVRDVGYVAWQCDQVGVGVGVKQGTTKHMSLYTQFEPIT
jgi:hypothetical protein